jgi:hypothetical protein
LEIAGLTCSAPDMGRPGRRERCRLDRTSRVSVSITDMVRSVLEGAQGFRTQTGLRRHSNQPLLAGGNSAGKEFGEARDWAAVFGDSGRFWGTETAPSRVFGRLASLPDWHGIGPRHGKFPPEFPLFRGETGISPWRPARSRLQPPPRSPAPFRFPGVVGIVFDFPRLCRLRMNSRHGSNGNFDRPNREFSAVATGLEL